MLEIAQKWIDFMCKLFKTVYFVIYEHLYLRIVNYGSTTIND